MKLVSLQDELSSTTYPGRGIVVGRSEDGSKAVAAYFIMGRSQNSRNRIFVEEGNGLRTQAFDESLVKDPRLIIYSPVRVLKSTTIVSNGDQTDTIYEHMQKGESFERALATREFEPDAPNYTPRISAILETSSATFSYQMSIIKSDDMDPTCCNRNTFSYDNPRAGEGRFLHTYKGDGDPLPSFEGEPTRVDIKGDIDSFTDLTWKSLDPDNKISLFVRFIDIQTGNFETRIRNKNQ